MHLKTTKGANRRVNRTRPITVHFPVPKNAISKLRALAIGKDPRLLDLGVLSVQISHDENIVLGIELDKAKSKERVYANRADCSSYTHSTNVGGSVAKTGASRSLGTAVDVTGFDSKRGITTARNDNPVSKTKKPLQSLAAKRRARESLIAARRGKGRGRAQAGDSLPARASTWEMVYSHIGLPRERHGKASDQRYLEPTVGSQASGVAHVPVAQPGQPKESIVKAEGRRKVSGSNPTYKSPGHSAVYSEDDSSVSSSPCSHSPMNQEELLNLFVDSNFSATSVLKQLAESRVKEEEKESHNTNKNNANSTTKSTENGTNSQSLENKPDGSVAGNTLGRDSPANNHWGPYHSSSAPPHSSTANQDSKTITDASISGMESKPVSSTYNTLGVGLSHFNPSTLSNTSVHTNTMPGKRSASSLVELYSGSATTTVASEANRQHVHAQLAENSAKKQRRSFVELELKREMGISGQMFEHKLQSWADPLKATSSRSSTQSLRPNQISNLLASHSNNMALKNYSQYGYYYSSEDLNKALAKYASTTTTTKSETASSPLPSHHTSNELASKNQYAQEQVSTAKNQPAGPQSSSLVSDKSPFSPQAQNGCLGNGSLKNTNYSTLKSRSSMDTSLTSIVQTTSPETNTKDILSEASPAISHTLTMSTKTLLTDSDLAQAGTTTAADPNNNIKRSGQCYALSYVYPMGTVWYPYVAITPYAMLNKSQKNKAETTNDKNKNVTETGSPNGSQQYIDLASSLRYWQQLNLLYKKQMLATTALTSSILAASDQSKCANVAASSHAMTNVAHHTKQTFATSKTEGIELDLQDSRVSNFNGQAFPSNSGSDKKPARRPSVIVTAMTSDEASSPANSVKYEHNSPDVNGRSNPTPESDTSLENQGSEVMQARTEGLVIDNCNRLIEEHCHRMSEVFADASKDVKIKEGLISAIPAPPSLSFIPDSSIAYVNVGNNNGQAKFKAGTGKDGKGKSAKRRKSNKSV